MSGGLDEIYKEGLRIPVVRLYRRGIRSDEIPITARRVVTFHASQKLKSDVELACDGTAA